MFSEARGHRRKSYEEMCECRGCGEYFGTSEECPICGANTVAIGKDIEVFEPSRTETDDDTYSNFDLKASSDDDDFAYLSDLDGLSLEGEEFLPDAA